MSIRHAVYGLALAASLVSFGAQAAAPADNEPLMTKKVRDNLYFVSGGGGNSSIIIGANGVIVVDVKTTPEAGKGVVDAVAKLTNKPITTVIYTHSDGDHINGIVSFPKGIQIVAHANDKAEIEAAEAANARGVPPKELLPTTIVTGTGEDMTIDGVKMRLIHVGPAHTSGDLAIYLPDQKVAIIGDLMGNGDPTIHREKKGESAGWMKFVSALIALDTDTYMRGHADPATKAQLQDRLKQTEEKRAKIAAMIKEGKSVAEVKQALGDTGRSPTFVENTYDELKS
jgi:glyoxylase-like metal-dependent hydrolase (beta-lactamase superfamily II)